MARRIHISIGSTMSKPGDVTGNLRQIGRFAKQAADVGADLLLTPELSATGYGSYAEVLAASERAGQGRIYESLARIAGTTNVTVCAGFVEAAGDWKHLSHYVVYPGGKFVVQRKNRVMRAERPLAPATPHSGQRSGHAQFTFFDIRGVRCGLAICADAGLENVNDIFHRNGVQLMLAPTGAGGKRKDRVVTRDLRSEKGRRKYYKWLERVFFPGRGLLDCMEYRRALAAVNMCGHDGRAHYHLGHGMIINPMGEVVGFFHGMPNLDRQRPMFAHAEVDVEDCLP